jgi:preprotein translocase subunit SecF
MSDPELDPVADLDSVEDTSDVSIDDGEAREESADDRATDAARAPRMSRAQSFAHRLYTGEMSYQFVARRKTWYTVSAVLLTISILAFAFKGLNLGIEFRGGAEFTVSVQASTENIEKVRSAVLDAKLPEMSDVPVQGIGDGQIRVQSRAVTAEEIPVLKQAIGDAVGVDPDEVAYSVIGASWGQQITNQGLIALVVFLVLVSLLIWVYFREAKMAIAALVGLLHDLAITVGVFSIAGFAFTPASLIGMLTILGYSLYDNVVVFDKVRDNTRNMAESPLTYSQAANLAVNQVLVRSINTTIIGVLPVAALLFTGVFVLGTGPLKDVGLVLFVGMIAGAYSSIFIATPLLAQMKEREPAMIAHRRRLEKRAQRSAKVAATAGASSTDSSAASTNKTDRRPRRK